MLWVNKRLHSGKIDKLSPWNKLSNDEFLFYFNHCDLIVLTETWRSDQFTLPGYELFTNPSKKHHEKKNAPQEAALGFKTALKQGIKFISAHENFIWAKLDKHFFNIDQTIFLCAIYIPPRGSPYFNSDIFTDLEKDITKFSTEGLIMLTGDLNARTGSALDFVNTDHCIHIPGINLPQKHNLRRRKKLWLPNQWTWKIFTRNLQNMWSENREWQNVRWLFRKNNLSLPKRNQHGWLLHC
jgi:hypothetical protein